VSDYITPGDVMNGFWRWFGVGVFALIVLGALILGGWQAGWWFTNQDNNRTAHMVQNGYANQSSLISALDNDIQQLSGITGSDQAAVAQRIAIGNDACKAASQITVSLGTSAAWVKANCAGPAVSAGSSLRK
jgi:hypothetical protein